MGIYVSANLSSSMVFIAHRCSCPHVWRADPLCPGHESTPMLSIPRLALQTLCHLRQRVRRAFGTASSGNTLSYTVGLSTCIPLLLSQLSSVFPNLSVLITGLGCPLPHWDVVWPDLDLAAALSTATAVTDRTPEARQPRGNSLRACWMIPINPP